MNSVLNLKMKKNLLVLALIAALTPGLTACTDDEVGAAIGGIIIGVIIGGAISDGHDNHDNDHGRGRDHGGRRGGRPGWRHGVNMNASVTGAEVKSQSGVDVNAFASEFAISADSAKTFIAAMEEAKAGNGKVIMSLGFSGDDMKKFSKYEMPSNEGIESLAKNINADSAAVHEMVEVLLDWAIEQRTLSTPSVNI